MATVNAYLTFNGSCEAAFQFYKSVFGGEFATFSTFGDMPPMEGHELPDSAKKMVMHVALPISKETVLMGSDANPMMGIVTIGQNISLAVGADSKEEADRIFNSLSEGGEITMPIADMFWGAYFGMLKDKFANVWMVNFDYKKEA